MREFVGKAHEDLKDLVDDLVPFKSTHAHNLVTILNDDDLKDSGFYSDVSILS